MGYDGKRDEERALDRNGELGSSDLLDQDLGSEEDVVLGLCSSSPDDVELCRRFRAGCVHVEQDREMSSRLDAELD